MSYIHAAALVLLLQSTTLAQLSSHVGGILSYTVVGGDLYIPPMPAIPGLPPRDTNTSFWRSQVTSHITYGASLTTRYRFNSGITLTSGLEYIDRTLRFEFDQDTIQAHALSWQRIDRVERNLELPLLVGYSWSIIELSGGINVALLQRFYSRYYDLSGDAGPPRNRRSTDGQSTIRPRLMLSIHPLTRLRFDLGVDFDNKDRPHNYSIHHMRIGLSYSHQWK